MGPRRRSRQCRDIRSVGRPVGCGVTWRRRLPDRRRQRGRGRLDCQARGAIIGASDCDREYLSPDQSAPPAAGSRRPTRHARRLARTAPRQQGLNIPPRPRRACATPTTSRRITRRDRSAGRRHPNWRPWWSMPFAATCKKTALPHRRRNSERLRFPCSSSNPHRKRTPWLRYSHSRPVGQPATSRTAHSTEGNSARPWADNQSSRQFRFEDLVLGPMRAVLALLSRPNGRRCYAIEISPAYRDCAIVRWQDFVGEKAMLDGRSFAEVKDARCNPNCDMAEGVAIASEAVPPSPTESSPP
jgi:hypothetical protein